MLGHTSCLNKPVLCATWMCYEVTQKLWPETHKFMNRVRDQLYKVHIFSDAYSQGIVREHFLKPNLVQQKALRECIREVRAWNEARVEQP